MSYIVLARKYRPRNFAEMVGQEHVVQALSNALQQQRLHHAYLFTGTRGVGKTTVSRILAKSLNCQGVDGQGGITAEPCGVCQACRDIDAGRFVDYTELDAASNRGVVEVQSLLEQAVYKPVQGSFKVFMIDEVHMLTNTAFNAMLKTLEEPPEYLKFVLATTDPQKVPVTVLSRCLQFNLRPMAPETVFEHLTHVLLAEQIPAEPAALRQLARAARGSMRDALSLTDQAIAYGGGQLQETGVRQMLGSADRSHVLGLLGALSEGDGASVVTQVDGLRLHGVSAAATLEDMGAVLQRMAVMQSGAALGGSNDPDEAAIAALASSLPPDQTQLLYSICLHGRAELGLAPDEYAALTMVLLRLLAFRPEAWPAAQKKNPALTPKAPPATRPPLPTQPEPATRSAPAKVATPVAPLPASPTTSLDSVALRPTMTAPSAPRPAPAAAAATPHLEDVPDDAPDLAPWDDTPEWDDGAFATTATQAPASPAPAIRSLPVREASAPSPRVDVPRVPAVPLEITPQGDFWMLTVQRLIAEEAVTALVRELALQSQLLSHDSPLWKLRIERESLNMPSTRERLQAALRAAGWDVSLQVEIGPVADSPARRLAQEAEARMRAAQDLIENDPLVQSMVRDFGAKIVPGSIQPI